MFITYRINDKEMYDFFKRVCKNNWKRKAKICEECPFKGYIASASQTYAFSNDLEDPLKDFADL